MSYNPPSIDRIYESDEEYYPSEESSFIYKKYDIIKSEQVQIEYIDYRPNNFRGSVNQLQTQKRPSETAQMDHDFMNDDFQSPSALKRHSSVYAMIGEKGEDLSESIFSESNSRSDSHFSSSGMEVPTQKKTTRSQAKRNHKKSQQRVFKQIKSQISSDSIPRPRRNTSSSNRKGKHSQSKTQKFIYFCTQFHYSKNFNQYLRKKIIQKPGRLEKYNNSTFEEKINTLNKIIAEIGDYKMAIHYKIQESDFMASFSSEEKNLIRQLFWKVIQKTYKTRLELEKKYVELSEEEAKPENRRFFDEKGEAEFNKIFDTVLAEEPFASVLKACKFEALLEEAMMKMSKKQQF